MNWDFTFQKIQTQTFSLAVKDKKRRHMSNVRNVEWVKFLVFFLFMISEVETNMESTQKIARVELRKKFKENK